jgi:DNA-binding response OmpR family regulator
MSERHGRVLVVDDDAAIRRSLERGLRLSGFEVELAGGGQAALAALRLSPPDVLVLDGSATPGTRPRC